MNLESIQSQTRAILESKGHAVHRLEVSHFKARHPDAIAGLRLSCRVGVWPPIFSLCHVFSSQATDSSLAEELAASVVKLVESRSCSTS